MTTASLSEFRNNQSEYIASVQREPVTILSRGSKRRAVLVSPEFYDRAIEALEDQIDKSAARAARERGDWVSEEDVWRELGLPFNG